MCGFTRVMYMNTTGAEEEVETTHTSSIVALSGVTRTLNLEVCTVSREDSRWKADSTSDKCGEKTENLSSYCKSSTQTHSHTQPAHNYTMCMPTYLPESSLTPHTSSSTATLMDLMMWNARSLPPD